MCIEWKIKDIIATLRDIRLNIPPVCSGFFENMV